MFFEVRLCQVGLGMPKEANQFGGDTIWLELHLELARMMCCTNFVRPLARLEGMHSLDETSVLPAGACPRLARTLQKRDGDAASAAHQRLGSRVAVRNLFASWWLPLSWYHGLRITPTPPRSGDALFNAKAGKKNPIVAVVTGRRRTRAFESAGFRTSTSRPMNVRKPAIAEAARLGGAFPW